MNGNSKNSPLRTFALILALTLGWVLAPAWLQAKSQSSKPTAEEEFFIVSSLDAKKNQIVLKRPTEVTELVRVTDKTAYLDENGKPLHLEDLRAGDTVYAVFGVSSEGVRVVTRLRKGPMTVEELHARYLRP